MKNTILAATIVLFAGPVLLADKPRLSDDAKSLLDSAATSELAEYRARLREYEAGRSPANAVIQANRRLLEAALASGTPDAALDYDCRAAKIELLAERNLESRQGTKQEVAQAKSARLDAFLFDLLKLSRPDET